MTQDEIKKIAEDYTIVREGEVPEPRSTLVYDETYELLEWLTDNYFIVEKNKVIEKYKAIRYLNQLGCQDRLELLEEIFGADAFKKE